MLKLVARIVHKPDAVEINGDETDTKGQPLPYLSGWNGKYDDTFPWTVLRNDGWHDVQTVDDVKLDGWLIFHKPETDEDRLHIECAGYDWFYQMSDDSRVYNAGRAKDGVISRLISLVGQREGVKIWRKYVVRTLKGMVDNPDGGLFFLESYFNAFGGG